MTATTQVLGQVEADQQARAAFVEEMFFGTTVVLHYTVEVQVGGRSTLVTATEYWLYYGPSAPREYFTEGAFHRTYPPNNQRVLLRGAKVATIEHVRGEEGLVIILLLKTQKYQ